MMKKVSLLALTVAGLLVLLLPGLVQAQGGLTILASSAEVAFPLGLRFNLSAGNDAVINDIRLHYTVDRESYAQVTSEAYLEFVPDTAVDVEWSLDMRKTGGLPPGATLSYWWTVRDISGRRIKTDPVKVNFDDARYAWRSLTEGMVTIYWYEGQQSFAVEIMGATRQALSRLSEETGAYLRKPVGIYLYASSADLRGAMVFPQEWTGGVAYTRYGTIAIGVAADNLDWGKRAIAHELTHLVVHQMTLNPYNDLPTWLDEGLAMYNEGALEEGFRAYLGGATYQNSFISVRSLSSPFSAHAEESYLSYAQSYSLVEFLVGQYGRGKMLLLLDTFRQGSSYDGALDKVYGFDMDGLDKLWRQYVTQQYTASPGTATGRSPAAAGATARWRNSHGQEIVHHP